MIDRWTRVRLVFVLLTFSPAVAAAQITAQARGGATPPWTKGILPINPESYYNAIECGKQGGADPSCVFWDTGLCKNADFALTFYTAYKSVAYEVWRVVNQKKPAPQPSYAEAQRTRITVALMPVRGSNNPVKDLVVKRGARTMMPVDHSVSADGGRFTYDYPAFAPSADVTLEMVGQAKTIACRIPKDVLTTFR